MKLLIEFQDKSYELDVELLPNDAVRSKAAGALTKRPQLPVFSHSRRKTNGHGDPKDLVCRSPLRGLVARVDVAAGQSVEPDQTVVVLEAMKMETNITAPGALKVKFVNVQPGAGVQVGQVLVEFE